MAAITRALLALLLGMAAIGPALAQPVTTFPPALLPLSGSEQTYLIQGGNSKQITVGNLLTGWLNTGLVTATAATTGRTLPAYFSDLLNAKNYGAFGNGSGNDLAALNATFAAGTNSDAVYLPPGLYPTGLAATADNLTTFGPGRLLDSSGNRRAPYHSTIQAAPSPSAGNNFDYNTWANADLSHQPMAMELSIEGTCTLGCPTTGFLNTPETAALHIAFQNNSGWNQQTTGNDGRTAGTAMIFSVNSTGQGDTGAILITNNVSSTRAGATSFLANPGANMISGDVGAEADGVYLQGLGDLNFSDNGHDVAAIPVVINMLRTNNTGALGATWMGLFLNSAGTKAIDSFASFTGPATVGIDLSTATMSAGMALPANAGVFFNATNPGSPATGARFSNTTNAGNTYVLYDSAALLLAFGVNGAIPLGLQSTQIQAAVPIVLANYTVATLPTCNTSFKRAIASVSDALTPTYNGSLTGGGTGASANIPVFCNGTSWTAH